MKRYRTEDGFVTIFGLWWKYLKYQWGGIQKNRLGKAQWLIIGIIIGIGLGSLCEKALQDIDRYKRIQTYEAERMYKLQEQRNKEQDRQRRLRTGEYWVCPNNHTNWRSSNNVGRSLCDGCCYQR